MKILIMFTSPSGKKGKYQTDLFPCELGRDHTDNGLVLDDPSVSKQHATVVLENGQLFIRDNNSRNGININGTLLRGKKRRLKNNDTVILGETILVFTIEKKEKGKKQKRRFAQPDFFALLSQRRTLLVILFVLLSITALLQILHKKEETAVSSQPTSLKASGQPISLPHHEQISCSGTDDCNKILIGFVGVNGQMELRSELKKTGSITSLRVLLNGKEIAQLNDLPEWWSQQNIMLPREYVIPAEENTLLLIAPGARAGDVFVLREMSVFSTPDRPCDKDQARKEFDLGRELLAERHLSRQNLYFAVQHLSEAVALSAQCRSMSELYTSAKREEQKASEIFDQEYKKLYFRFRRAEKLSEKAEARKLLDDIMELFPDKTDPRAERISQLIKEKDLHNKK